MSKRNTKTQKTDQTTGAIPPDLKLNLGSRQPGSKTKTETPATGQGASPNPDAVGAGHGNQVQDNFKPPSDQTDQSKQNDLKPGALPDGTASVGERKSRNEDVEQINESRLDSGIE